MKLETTKDLKCKQRKHWSLKKEQKWGWCQIPQAQQWKPDDRKITPSVG